MADAPRAAGAPLFCLNVCLRVKPERREEFIACILNNQRCTLGTEPLVMTYVFGEDESTPNTWHFFEAYRGRAGFEQHARTAHFAAWEAFAATDPFTAPPRVDFWATTPT
jgi:quinol monooxygenase YgiN